jgi:hypothetical protein
VSTVQLAFGDNPDFEDARRLLGVVEESSLLDGTARELLFVAIRLLTRLHEEFKPASSAPDAG